MAADWYVLVDATGQRWCDPSAAALLNFVLRVNLRQPGDPVNPGVPMPEAEPWAVPGTRTISGRPCEPPPPPR
jgi:hypothetical protein